jgi:hypothetical protein
VAGRAGDVHVLPIGDRIGHVPWRSCGCRPSESETDPQLVIHHSADGREHRAAHRPN